jgi:hypothetical protein
MKLDSLKLHRSILTLGLLIGASATGHATILGFGQIPAASSNNNTIPAAYGSNATADTFGVVVSNGATPNIALAWQDNWDIHRSTFFNALEDQSVGGGTWDRDGDPYIGQLDFDNHSVAFNVSAGFALVLNSFDFAHTPEGYPASGGTNTGEITWNLSLTHSTLGTVWQQTVNFSGGQVFTITPAFTGALGESYTLNFLRTSQSAGINSNGRHGIDNLSFNQVPEPTAAGLLGLAGLMLLARRRK